MFNSVSRTPVRKMLRYKFFSYFVKSLVECTLHLYFEFLLIFIFRHRQANIGRTVLSPVSTALVKNLSAVSLTPANSFLAVSLTLPINFRLFGYL
jgi:hypothetical protein